jgi:hypothetical protein
VTERGLPIADEAPACPFVAFEDDRDERASVPDHRHRCYADARPAPRALAHQEAYCLSSAFPVCPTFQDWARREAARARGGAPTASSASAGMNRAATGAAAGSTAAPDQAPVIGAGLAAVVGAEVARAGAAHAGGADEQATSGDGTGAASAGGAGGAGIPRPAGPERSGRFDPDDHRGSSDDDDGDDARSDDGARRNPPRDWAAPPPWLASSEARRDDAEPPAFLGHRTTDPGQGLAGSAADRMAGGPPPARHDDPDDGVWSSDSRSAAAIGAGLAAGGAGSAAAAGQDADAARRSAATEDLEHDDGNPAPRRSRAYAQHLGGPDGPDWERPRRYEAYPAIKTRVGLPAVPRVLGLFGLVIVLALALFFLPGILNLGGSSGSPGSSAGSSSPPGPSVSLVPTVPPAPTPIVYTIKHNDTLVKIAKAYGVTIEQLRAANPSIKDPNKISEGQQITIPTPASPPPDTIGGSAGP